MKAEYVYGIDEIPAGSDEYKVGVVLSYEKEDKQMHCGLSYDVEDSSKAKILHLGFQNLLRRDEAFGDFKVWIKPNIPPLQLEAFSAWCEVVWNKFNTGTMEIAYGLRYDEYANIQPDGLLVLGNKNTGFTCATLILTLFHMCGYDLIDLDTWSLRPEDIKWQEKIVDLFKNLPPWTKMKYRVTDEQQVQLSRDIGCKRYHPEDVAVSSALYNEGPAANDAIKAAADKLYDYVVSLP